MQIKTKIKKLQTDHIQGISTRFSRKIYKFKIHTLICLGAISILLISLPFGLTYAAPPINNTISINSGAEFTGSAATTLTLSSTDSTYGLSQMQFSCNNSTWSAAESYATTKSFNLTSDAGCTSAEGVKYVYVKYKNTNNEWSAPVWDWITLDTLTPNINPLDAGASAADRTSLTSGSWFINSNIGGDDLLSYGWTDPASASKNYFYYTENTSASDSLAESGLIGWWPFERNGNFYDAKDGNAAAKIPGAAIETDSGRTVFSHTINYNVLVSSDYIPVDTAKSYILSGDFKSAGTANSVMYYGLAPYDENHVSISSDRIYRMGNDVTISSYTDTQINVGQTLSGWNSTGSIDYSRSIGFYYDGDTTKLPDYVMYNPSFYYDTDAAHGFYSTASGTTIMLNLPIPPAVAASIITGTTVIKNHSFSSSYMYSTLIGSTVPASWNNYSSTITGEDWGPNANVFWKGTKYVKILFLTNYNAGSSKILFDDLNFRQANLNGATDFSGNGSNGTLLSGTTYTDGKLGQAGSFDGTDDSITATTPGSPTSYTYSMWINPQSSANRRLFFHHGTAGSGGTQYLELLSDNTILNVHGSSPYTSLITTGTAPNNTWTHYAVTWDGTTMKAYLNGSQDPAGQSGSAAYLPGGETFIGQDASLYYKGALDEVKVYDRALSAAEIANEYNKRMSVAPFLDTVWAIEGSKYMHVKPLTGALTWGTERIFNTKYDNASPTLDSLTVSNPWWKLDGTTTQTITIKSTEAASGIGGTYGMLALINYQGSNSPNYRGYFAWHPTTYIGSLNQMTCTGGGVASKIGGGWGEDYNDLTACSTSVDGNQRTVVFTVLPKVTFGEYGQINDVSFFSNDNVNYYTTWTNFDVNFGTDAYAPSSNSISINAGATNTTVAAVTLTLSSTDTVSGLNQMQFSCDNSTWTAAESYSTTKSFNLNTQSGAGCTTANGTKTVYAKFKDTAGNWSASVNDTITMDIATPTVTKLGTGSTDYQLFTGTPVDLIFNISLTSQAKSAVEFALRAGTNQNLSLTWSLNDTKVTISASTDVTFANDATATIADAEGNTATDLLLIDSVLDSNQINNTGDPVFLGPVSPEMVIQDTQGVELNVPLSVTAPQINLGPLIYNNTGILPPITINSVTSIGNVSVAIPAGTTITGGSGWNELLSPPIVRPNDSVTPTVTPGSEANVLAVYEIGSSEVSITFDRGVKIIFEGLAGSLVGYQTGEVFTEITATCSEDSQAAGDALAAGGNCKINSGSDLVVWTKHFTDYVAYDTNNPPVITDITPTNGPPAGGTNVTITGSNFGTEPGDPLQLTFDGTPATNINVVDGNTITATTPAHSVGPVNVVVTNPNDLNDTLTDGFEYTTCTAGADEQCLQFTIGGAGALTLSVPDDFIFGTFASPASTYSKDDTNYDLDMKDLVVVSDLRASGGFTLQLQVDSAGFGTGTGNYLPLQNFYVATTASDTGGTAAYGVEYEGPDTTPQDIVAYQDANVNRTGSALQTASTFTTCGSNLGSGSTFTTAGTPTAIDLMIGGVQTPAGRQGTFKQNVNFYLGVPSGQPPGNYSAVLTYTLIDSTTAPPSQPATCNP